jgi:hypothetical protein
MFCGGILAYMNQHGYTMEEFIDFLADEPIAYPWQFIKDLRELDKKGYSRGKLIFIK